MLFVFVLTSKEYYLIIKLYFQGGEIAFGLIGKVKTRDPSNFYLCG